MSSASPLAPPCQTLDDVVYGKTVAFCEFGIDDGDHMQRGDVRLDHRQHGTTLLDSHLLCAECPKAGRTAGKRFSVWYGRGICL